MTILKMNPDEYWISAEYAPMLYKVLERYGVTEESLQEQLDEKDVADWHEKDARIPLEQFRKFMNVALEQSQAPWLGWEFGLTLNLSSHGFLGYAAMSSETLGDAVDLAVKYFRTRGTVMDIQHFIEDDVAVIQVEELVALNEIAPFMIENLFSSFHVIGQKMLGDLPIEGELRFAFPEPDYFERIKPLLPIPVTFDCAYNQMRFPASRLEQPLKFSDPRLAQMAQAQCEAEMANIKTPPRLLNKVRRIILADSWRSPGVEEVASELHMSARTLKRKLQQLGTSYQVILSDLRKALAVEYLTQTDMTVDDIAIQLGYSDASNFARAFRRWTSKSPSDYRR